MDIEKTLKFYCDVKHVDRQTAVELALRMMLYPYQSDYGEYRQFTWKRDSLFQGEPLPKKIENVPCWVLGETRINGYPYYRICDEHGDLHKVPADCVEMDSPAGSAE